MVDLAKVMGLAVPAAGAAPTKAFFVPVVSSNSAGWQPHEAVGDFGTAKSVGNNQYTHFAFRVPHDFSTIVTAVVLCIPTTGDAAAARSILSDYAALGEAYNTHSEQDITTTYDDDANEITAYDISGILTALVADDYVGIKVLNTDPDRGYTGLGIYFRYS